ncbi:hypothetical protein GQ53DRAFT_768170 [Thozetella sp. PMI_491]|nr:hypothetical protein GQ53DRAFT_768170 [Thozetella sp. PMI_491]
MYAKMTPSAMMIAYPAAGDLNHEASSHKAFIGLVIASRADGRVADNAYHSWKVWNFTLDTAQMAKEEPLKTMTRFSLRSPLMHAPIRCWGLMHPSDVYEFQDCEGENATALEDPWISFDYNFLLDNYLQINETWKCPGKGTKSVTIQATGGLGLGWYLCNGSAIAKVERQLGPGHCEVVTPISPEELDSTTHWTRSDYILNASAIVVIPAA